MLPCYNPPQGWTSGIIAFNTWVSHRYDIKYIVVNDGSKLADPAAGIQELTGAGINVNYISYAQNMGKGFALRKGVQQADAPVIVYTDIDFPFENESVLEVIRSLESGNDVAAGYREKNYYQKVPFMRKVISRIFRTFLKYILRIKITDTQCGLKGFNQKGKVYFLNTTINRYLFDFEFIYRVSRKKDLNIAKVPAVLKNGIVFRKMPLSILFTETLNLFKVILRRK